MTPTVGRLAPSPTGLLHLGHARSFLLAWWSARAQGGRVVLRLEDLDAERAHPEFIAGTLRDLEWLGLDWDGEALLQSSELERLNANIQSLLERGLAYPCTCTRSDLQQSQSAPQQGTLELRYPGTCRGRYTSMAEAEARSGRRPGIRLVVPSGTQHFDDRLRGPQTFDVQAETGDFLIARRSGMPAYQLAVVVDDAHQGVTEVVRGEDLLSSTARQICVRQALRLPEPRVAHVALVVDDTGRRLAKRAASLGLSELRARGIDAESVVAWAARTAGFHELGARASAREVLEIFELDRWAKQEPRQVPAPTPDSLIQN
ncbi:MAG TPA: tRNA glutamyl-Q(34) synthetase GluQRS [Polyangiaceae bacterium]|nr:tRNA glutamyl-Q(34) synthetase GluQRS [Polyangiaceae bacterium]